MTIFQPRGQSSAARPTIASAISRICDALMRQSHEADTIARQ